MHDSPCCAATLNTTDNAHRSIFERSLQDSGVEQSTTWPARLGRMVRLLQSSNMLLTRLNRQFVADFCCAHHGSPCDDDDDGGRDDVPAVQDSCSDCDSSAVLPF